MQFHNLVGETCKRCLVLGMVGSHDGAPCYRGDGVALLHVPVSHFIDKVAGRLVVVALQNVDKRAVLRPDGGFDGSVTSVDGEFQSHNWQN